MMQFFRQNGDLVDLNNLLLRTPGAFMLAGGASAEEHNLERLNQRGIWTMAINNMGGHPRVRPSSFVCSDPPKKFHQGIWLDPGIMKFIPRPKLKKGRGALRHREGSGEITAAPYSACDCPNVWGFDRRVWFQPDDTFFTDSQASWGNLDAGVKRTGLEKTVCTMLLAIRLLYELGIRKIFFVGVDFEMSYGYCFGQNRDDEAIRSNNDQFSIVNKWLCQMKNDGVFDRVGLEITNCNGRTKLEAFSHTPFDDAVDSCLDGFPSSPFDLSGWYEK